MLKEGAIDLGIFFTKLSAGRHATARWARCGGAVRWCGAVVRWRGAERGAGRGGGARRGARWGTKSRPLLSKTN